MTKCGKSLQTTKVYISPRGSDCNPGCSPKCPKRTPEAALKSVVNNASAELIFAPGTYNVDLDSIKGPTLLYLTGEASFGSAQSVNLGSFANDSKTLIQETLPATSEFLQITSNGLVVPYFPTETGSGTPFTGVGGVGVGIQVGGPSVILNVSGNLTVFNTIIAEKIQVNLNTLIQSRSKIEMIESSLKITNFESFDSVLSAVRSRIELTQTTDIQKAIESGRISLEQSYLVVRVQDPSLDRLRFRNMDLNYDRSVIEPFIAGVYGGIIQIDTCNVVFDKSCAPNFTGTSNNLTLKDGLLFQSLDLLGGTVGNLCLTNGSLVVNGNISFISSGFTWKLLNVTSSIFGDLSNTAGVAGGLGVNIGIEGGLVSIDESTNWSFFASVPHLDTSIAVNNARFVGNPILDDSASPFPTQFNFFVNNGAYVAVFSNSVANFNNSTVNRISTNCGDFGYPAGLPIQCAQDLATFLFFN